MENFDFKQYFDNLNLPSGQYINPIELSLPDFLDKCNFLLAISLTSCVVDIAEIYFDMEIDAEKLMYQHTDYRKQLFGTLENRDAWFDKYMPKAKKRFEELNKIAIEARLMGLMNAWFIYHETTVTEDFNIGKIVNEIFRKLTEDDF